MALTLTNKTIELKNGLTIDTAYVRTECYLNNEGNSVNAYPTLWASKEAYESLKNHIEVSIDLIFDFPYDRNVDGADTLTFANNKVKEVFESMGFSVEVDL